MKDHIKISEYVRRDKLKSCKRCGKDFFWVEFKSKDQHGQDVVKWRPVEKNGHIHTCVTKKSEWEQKHSSLKITREVLARFPGVPFDEIKLRLMQEEAQKIENILPSQNDPASLT